MNIGIFSKTYENCSLEETFQKLNNDDIYHVQFNFASAGLSPLPDTIPAETIKSIKTLAQQYSIKMDVVYPDGSTIYLLFRFEEDDYFSGLYASAAYGHRMGITYVHSTVI